MPCRVYDDLVNPLSTRLGPMKKQAAAKRPAKKATIAAVPSLILPPGTQAQDAVSKAMLSGQWIVAAFRIVNGQLILDRVALNFPKADIGLAQRLFVENLEQLKVD